MKKTFVPNPIGQAPSLSLGSTSIIMATKQRKDKNKPKEASHFLWPPFLLYVSIESACLYKLDCLNILIGSNA